MIQTNWQKQWYSQLKSSDAIQAWQLQQSQDGETWTDVTGYERATGVIEDVWGLLSHFRRYNLAGLSYRVLNIDTGEVKA